MRNEVEDLKRRAMSVIDSCAQQLVEVSHEIHDHPEQNFEEVFASEMLVRAGSGLGMNMELGVFGAETGFMAEAGTGPLVCVMSEYDALPDIGHGCGHNVIAAAGLGAAAALAAVAIDAGGSVRYLGTPAEEGGGGKIVMARHGALDGVELAMMVHSAGEDLTTIDAIALRQLVMEYSGVEAHAAAAPHKGRNALDAAVIGYMSVAALRQHILPNERIHGIFTKAGEKPNIVPREASTEWYIRSETLDSLNDLSPRVVAALEAGAHACGCRSSHAFPGETYANLLPNQTMTASWVSNAARLGRVVAAPGQGAGRVVGSTDMGNVSHLVPTIHPMIASAPAGSVIHTAAFAEHSRGPLADRAVVDGAKMLAMTAIDFWTSDRTRAAVRAEFAQTARSSNVLG